MSCELTKRTGIAAALAGVLLLGGCVGGGAVLPPSETSLEALYREAYGTADQARASGPMDVRMRAFCERFVRATRLGSLLAPGPVRVRACLETAAAEGLLSGTPAQRECEGPGCGEAFVVEERWPPPLHPGWSGSAVSGLDAVFPRLANPDVLVYVYPHVATPLGVGVPGYVTAMPLFERTEYALPGEAVSTVPPAEWPAWEEDGTGAEVFVASPRADAAGPMPAALAAGGTADGAGSQAGPDADERRPDVGDVVAGRAGLSSLLTGAEPESAADGILSGDVTVMVGDALERGAAVADAVSGFIGGDGDADAAGRDEADEADEADEDGTAGDGTAADAAAGGSEPETR